MNLPFVRIMLQKYLLLLGVKLLLLIQKQRLSCINLVKGLVEAHVGLPGILEEGAEVALEQVDFILYVVAPLNHHVVEFYIDLIEILDVLVLGSRVEDLPCLIELGEFIACCYKGCTEVIKLVDFIDALSLETFAGSGHFFVQKLAFIDEGPQLFIVSDVLVVEGN